MCHLLLALPVIGLAAFFFWPLSVAVPVYAATVALSLFFYAFLLRSMRRPVQTGREEMLHSTGSVLRAAGPHEYWIRAHGEEWRARTAETGLAPGDEVRIVGMDGMTLRVVRDAAQGGTDAEPAA